MQITVYRNFAKENNSTKIPTGGEVVNCNLKMPTSRLNPTFILESTDTTITHIKWDNRYYFVNDYNHTSNSVTEYICSVDPMGSWKSNIGASSQYVVRAASASNEYILDMLYPATTKRSRTAFGFVGLSDVISSAGTFVVGIINGALDAESAGTVVYYAMTETQFRFLMGKLFDSTLYSVSKELINPFQYIVSCNWFPFDLIDGSLVPVQFGFWSSGVAARVIKVENRIMQVQGYATITEHPEALTRGKYLNAAPYRMAEVSVYGFGHIPIDTMYLMDDQRVFVHIKCDLFSGMATMIISTASGYELSRTQTQFSVPVQVSQLNTNYLGTAQAILGSASSIGASAGGSYAAVANGRSAGGAVGGALGFINGIISATQAMVPSVSTNGTNGDATVYTITPNVYVDIADIVDEDVARNGRPLCEERTISSLSGYIQCINTDIEIPGTTTERDIIVSYMNSGFYYE